jgi:hypothetical protein
MDFQVGAQVRSRCLGMEFVMILHEPHPFFVSADPGDAGQRKQALGAIFPAIAALRDRLSARHSLPQTGASCGAFVIRV